ncbi:signal peptidase I [Streptomyces sp. NPDC058001]|uniref:signal peptidase I n=1 Tax=Streptomyces sp. NPDC058001 TaxID=3346300 RepID=UPI0036E977AA
MDTAAQHTERDRSSRTPDATEVDSVEPKDQEERSRSVFQGRRTWGPGKLAQAVPGGRITLTLLSCLVFLLLLSRFVLQPFEIPSSSMEPGLHIGDRVLVNKVAYRFGSEPRRGDVVVFDGTGYFGDADYIKRVVGVGGDRVVCCDSQGRIEVNGRSVDETYLHRGDTPSQVPFDVVVPDGRLFLLGDHRSNSSDSRDHLGSPGGGMIPVTAVVGRADWIAWPLARWMSLEQPDTYARVPAPGADTAQPAGGGTHG